MTNENGVLRQSIYYPYAWALKCARGRALSVVPDGPSYNVASLGRPIESIGVPAPGFGDVPYLDVVATLDPERKTACIFILNRDLERPQELEITWHDSTPSRVTAFETITGPDLKAVNTFTDPKRIVPQTLEFPKAGSTMSMRLPARSYSILSLAV
jgi:alpha-N-arabinofuranosidase